MTDTTTASGANRRTADHGAREALIRDLYAIAAFYVANPDHPLPTGITLLHHDQNVDVVNRVCDVWADGPVYGRFPQTDHDLPNTSVPVSFIVSARAPQ